MLGLLVSCDTVTFAQFTVFAEFGNSPTILNNLLNSAKTHQPNNRLGVVMDNQCNAILYKVSTSQF